MRIYLDACCLSRLTDDPTQTRVREEAEAVWKILRSVQGETCTWVSSPVLETEVGRNPDLERRTAALELISFATEVLTPGDAEHARAREFENHGLAAFDALHLATAELGGCDLFLTTDDSLLRRARRLGIRIRIHNPLSWWREVAGDPNGKHE